jgi:hypothetical protein
VSAKARIKGSNIASLIHFPVVAGSERKLWFYGIPFVDSQIDNSGQKIIFFFKYGGIVNYFDIFWLSG